MPVRLSLHGSFANHDLRAVSRLARSLAIEGVTLAARSPAADLTDLSGTASREVRHVFSSAGVQLVALDHTLGPKAFSPRADIDREIAAIDAVLRAAAELGRPTVCVDLISLPPPPPEDRPATTVTAEQAGAILIPSFDKPPAPPPVEERDPAFEASLDEALREIGRRADRLSVVIAFRASLASFASLFAGLKKADCPWFGVDVDSLAILSDDEDDDAIFSRIGSLIRHARARDAIKGAGRRVQAAAIGEGEVDFAQYLANLESAGYRGFVTIDSPADAPNLSKSLGFLRDLQT